MACALPRPNPGCPGDPPARFRKCRPTPSQGRPAVSISEPFIRRPIATSLLMLGILVFGIGAFNLLPVAALPRVDFPTIVVSTNYPGAGPDTMASAVATPLEQKFAALPGLAEMTSVSGVGNTTITLQFDLDRNIDGAAQDVQQAINAAQGLLPRDLPNPPTYRKTNPADRPVLIYAIHSDALPMYRVDEYAFTIIAQKLATVKGVAESRIFGQTPYAVHVQVNPAAIAARGIGFEEIRTADLPGERQSPDRQSNGGAPDGCARHQRPDPRCGGVSPGRRRLAQQRARPTRRHCRSVRRRPQPA
jgi:multidrug efflux pump subunit AcrB